MSNSSRFLLDVCSYSSSGTRAPHAVHSCALSGCYLLPGFVDQSLALWSFGPLVGTTWGKLGQVRQETFILMARFSLTSFALDGKNHPQLDLPEASAVAQPAAKSDARTFKKG